MQTISIVAFGLSGIFAIVAIVLWFRLNVRGIIDDLSGKKAERQIRELREQNIQNQMEDKKGRVVYDTSSGRITTKLGVGKKKESTSQLTTPLPKKRTETVNPSTVGEDTATTLLDNEEGTTVLEQDMGTTVLEVEEGTTVLETEEGTTVLEAEEGTTVLASEEPVLNNGYRLVLNEVVVHTRERI